MIKAKHILLLIILIFSIWLFRPRSNENGSRLLNTKIDKNNADQARKKYIITVAPGYYMPGRMPGNVATPLEAFTEVAAQFEAIYPDTQIKFVEVPALVREWLIIQQSAGLAPDIMGVDNIEVLWQDTQKGWYVPLDEFFAQPNPFVAAGAEGSRQWWDMFKYETITRGKLAPDGNTYGMSLDMVETGFYYNKDIFKKLSLSPPDDWPQFLDMMAKLRQAGYIPFVVSKLQLYYWGIDLIFDQLYYSILPGIDLHKDPVREEYLQGYLDWDEICFLHKKGFFTRHDPRWISLWRILKEFRQYTTKDISTDKNISLFITQRSAMTWLASDFVQQLAHDTDLEFDWGVFYPPPIPAEFCKYADGHPMCVIGGAGMQYVVTHSAIKDTGDIETSQRLKRCIAFLQLLTIPKNADLVVNEPITYLPNIKGTKPHKELLPFDEFLQRRYTTTKWSDTFNLKFNEIFIRMFELYLNDGITEDEFVEWSITAKTQCSV